MPTRSVLPLTPPFCSFAALAGSHPSDDHWAVRREAAGLLSTIARQFAAPHHNLQPRLCRVLAQALLDADKPLTSKYGAVVGLQVSRCCRLRRQGVLLAARLRVAPETG